jgi:hypothetical protein
MCLFKKEEKRKKWPIKLDVRQRTGNSLALKISSHVADYQPQSHFSVKNVKCHVATNRYHWTNIKHDADNGSSVVERRVGLLEHWICLPFEANTRACDVNTPVTMAYSPLRRLFARKSQRTAERIFMNFGTRGLYKKIVESFQIWLKIVKCNKYFFGEAPRAFLCVSVAYIGIRLIPRNR